MRTPFCIKIIGSDEADLLDKTLDYLKLKWNTKVTGHDSIGVCNYSFVVDLSKYELLYLRLTCKFESVVDINEYNRRKETA